MRKYLWIYMLVTVMFVIWFVNHFLNMPVQVQTVENIECEEKVDLKGYMIRTETVYHTETGGELSSVVKEEERVAKGTKIATVYVSGIDQSIKDKIGAVNDEISILEQSAARQESLGDDMVSTEAQIKSGISEIINMSKRCNYNGISLIKGEIELLLNHQADGGEDNKYSIQAKLSAAIAEKENLENQISSSKQDIYSSVGGVYTSAVDGYESVVTPENYDQLTVERLKELGSSAISENTNQYLFHSGDAVCKLVDNSLWMVASVITEKELYGMNSGDAVNIRFADISSTEFSGKVEYISDIVDGEAVIVISSNRYIETIYSIRQAEFELIKRSYKGLGVPVTAVRSIDGETGVFVDSSGVARLRKVDVLYTTDDVAIIKEGGELKMYDSIIVNGKDLENGKIVN